MSDQPKPDFPQREQPTRVPHEPPAVPKPGQPIIRPNDPPTRPSTDPPTRPQPGRPEIG